MTYKYFYIIVEKSESVTKADTKRSAELLIKLLRDGYEIMTATGACNAVHYVLVKNEPGVPTPDNTTPQRPAPNPPEKIPTS